MCPIISDQNKWPIKLTMITLSSIYCTFKVDFKTSFQDGVDKTSHESINEAAKAIAEELAERKKVENGNTERNKVDNGNTERKKVENGNTDSRKNTESENTERKIVENGITENSIEENNDNSRKNSQQVFLRFVLFT